MTDRVCFLIERHFHSRLYYWAAGIPVKGQHAQGGSDTLDHWSSQPDDGIAFARRDQAEAFLGRFLSGIGNVVEHMWVEREPLDTTDLDRALGISST